jgi:phosphoadenosine phosphosulfate reductase
MPQVSPTADLTDVPLAELRFHFASLSGPRQLERAFTLLPGRVAAVSSFGADSAVLLSMIAEIDHAIPVVFLDTGRHFPETLAYRQHLAEVLRLTNVIDQSPDAAAIARVDPETMLASFDPDRCCEFRKVQPLEKALAPYLAWINGRRRQQASTRAGLPTAEIAEGKLKLSPLAGWTANAIEAEFARRGLPQHPLRWRGFPSIGCAPCTRAVRPGEDSRAGRWAGHDKIECGIHRAAG